MNNQSINNTRFHRPLLEFSRLLRYQRERLQDRKNGPNLEKMDYLAERIDAIHGLYELLPGKRNGAWFLASQYQESTKRIKSMASHLEEEIGHFRESFTYSYGDTELTCLNNFLEELQLMLLEVGEDVERLGKSANIGSQRKLHLVAAAILK